MKMKIEKAKSDKIDDEKLWPYVHKVLEILGHPESLVTDESKIFDFTFSEPEKAKEISKKLGFEVKQSDYVVDVAEKLRFSGVPMIRCGGCGLNIPQAQIAFHKCNEE